MVNNIIISLGFNHVMLLAIDSQLQVETQSSDRVKYSSQELALCLIALNLTKFARFHKAQYL